VLPTSSDEGDCVQQGGKATGDIAPAVGLYFLINPDSGQKPKPGLFTLLTLLWAGFFCVCVFV
jgi:hypothetical protein